MRILQYTLYVPVMYLYMPSWLSGPAELQVRSQVLGILTRISRHWYLSHYISVDAFLATTELTLAGESVLAVIMFDEPRIKHAHTERGNC